MSNISELVVSETLKTCTCPGRASNFVHFEVCVRRGSWWHSFSCPISNDGKRELEILHPSFSLVDAQAIMASTDDPVEWGLANSIVSLQSAVGSLEDELKALEAICENAQVERDDLRKEIGALVRDDWHQE